MAWRKWLVRGLVFFVLGGMGAAALCYQRWTNPAAVRQQVLDKLRVLFPGADISLDSAYMRLLGGIAVSDLRLTRRDDPAKTEVAYFPSLVIYHDKEKLLEGKLAIRKLELNRPRFHAIRRADGSWNLAGIIGPPHLDEFLPTIVVHLGTLVLEDRRAAPPGTALQIKDVNLTVLNDPLPSVSFQGTGASDLAPALHLSGTWQRPTDDTTLSLRAAPIRLDGALIRQLAAYSSELAEHASHLQGTAGVRADLAYHPGTARPWSYELRCQLRDGKLSHPQVPLPLEQLTATIYCANGQVAVESFSARSGPTQVELHGRALSLSPDAEVRGTLQVTHLPLDEKLCESRLPPGLRQVYADYAPAGPVSLTLDFQREGGQWARHCVIHPEDLTASAAKFPYVLEHLTGTIEQELDPTRHLDVLKVDLAGYAGPRRISIQGNMTGAGPHEAVDIRVKGDDVPLDDKLRAALPPAYQQLAAAFHPVGLANFEAHLYRPGGTPEFQNRFVVHFHDASLQYDIFPYPLEGVSGVLDIQPECWDFHDFHGTHKGGEIHCRGRSQPGPDGNRLAVEISGRSLLIDADLEAALGPQLKKVWKTFTPTGRMDFLAQVDVPPHQEPDVRVTVTAVNCAIRPAFFPYDLGGLTGVIRYGRGRVQLENVVCRHGDTALAVDQADVYLKPEGGVWANLVNLKGNPLVPEKDFTHALPPLLRQVCETLQLRQPLGLKTQLTIETFPGEDVPPLIFWDGEILLRNATLEVGVPLEHLSGRAACRGRYNGHEIEGLVGNLLLQEATLFRQPFHDIHSQLEVRKEAPDVLRLPNLKAGIFGGDIGGEGRIDFGRGLRYELNLTASQIRLEEFGRHNLPPGTPISGLAAARIYVSGQGNQLKDLTGRGNLDLPDGRLYNLPLFLDLLKVLGLRRPDGTAFEEAHAEFIFRGPQVVVSRLDLFGNSFSLRGQGELNLDGSDINLEFYAVWARAMQMLPPIINEIPPAVSQYLLKIKMRGRVGDVQCTKEPVPVLVEPVKALLERMSGGRDGPPSRATASNQP